MWVESGGSHTINKLERDRAENSLLITIADQAIHVRMYTVTHDRFHGFHKSALEIFTKVNKRILQSSVSAVYITTARTIGS